MNKNELKQTVESAIMSKFDAGKARDKMIGTLEGVRESYMTKVLCNDASISLLHGLDDELMPGLETVHFIDDTRGPAIYRGDGGTVQGNYHLKYGVSRYGDVAELAKLITPTFAFYARVGGSPVVARVGDKRYPIEKCTDYKEVAGIEMVFMSIHQSFRNLSARWWGHLENGTPVHVEVALPMTRIRSVFHPVEGNSRENTRNWRVMLGDDMFKYYRKDLPLGTMPSEIAYQFGHRYYFWEEGTDVAAWFTALDEPTPEPA